MDNIIDEIKNRFGDKILNIELGFRPRAVRVKKDALSGVMKALKEEEPFKFNQLLDIAGIDFLNQTPRFRVVYILLSTIKNHRLNIEIDIDEADTIESVTGVWIGADWFERELYDMFGIKITGHPNMKKILMPEDFEGHPLRKDFPVRGLESPETRYAPWDKRRTREY